jgi:carboxyl-terminal processing protease
MLQTLFSRQPGIPSVPGANNWAFRPAIILLMACCLTEFCSSQDITPKEREQAQAMLKDTAKDVKTYYYDPHLHGLDWDAKVQQAKEKIDKENSLNRALTDIAVVLGNLNDSHTGFIPPPRPYKFDYGFQMLMIGDRCFVTRVRPGGDADSKGVKAGDQIFAVNGYKPTREDFWRLEYLFWNLRPQPVLQLGLRGFDGAERQVNVTAKFHQLPKVKDFYEMNYFNLEHEIDEDERPLHIQYASRDYNLLIVRLPAFMPVSNEVDAFDSKTEGYKAVLFDLRGDPGGSADMVQSLLGTLFDHKVKIGDLVGRGSTKPMETEHHFHKFNGKIAVLIDSKSASAAELFARVIQIEKRGVVIGDQSSGMVMEAKMYLHRTDGSTADSYLVYGAEVTVADIIMTDGQSLEKRGVVPDVVILPTPSDLASGRDPALAKAAELLNVQMSPEEAGKLFPYEWPKE